MNKKAYLIVGLLVILLWAILIIYNVYLPGIGEIFGYLFYVVIILGILAGVWLFIKPPKKAEPAP